MLIKEGEYQRLYQHKDFRKAIKAIKAVSKRLRINYAVVGGVAVYLHVKNPPEDYPDLDIMLDATPAQATKFVHELRKNHGFKIKLLESEPGTDVFAITTCGEIQVDIFTDQSERKYIRSTATRESISVKAIEPLVIEKLFRATPEDLLAAVDLLRIGNPDRALLFDLAGEYNLKMLLVKTTDLARRFSSGIIDERSLRAAVKKLSEGGVL